MNISELLSSERRCIEKVNVLKKAVTLQKMSSYTYFSIFIFNIFIIYEYRYLFIIPSIVLIGWNWLWSLMRLQMIKEDFSEAKMRLFQVRKLQSDLK